MDTPETPALPTAAPSPAEVAAPPAATPSGWQAMLRRPTLRVAAVAVLIILAQWVDSRMQMANLREEMAGRLAAADNLAKEGRSQAKQLTEVAAALDARLGAVEEGLSEAQSQALALEAMYQELSSSRDERVLAEVEQAVSIAMQQIQFAGNIEAALLALQGADARLAHSAQPRFMPLRKLIARDIERLKATPGADVTGLSIKIESVVAVVDGLPLAYTQRPQVTRSQQTPAGAKVGAEGTAREAASREAAASETATSVTATVRSYAGQLFGELWQELKQLVRIERIDQGDPALLSPTQSFFLRQNLKLHLLTARLALLQRDDKTFREEIHQTRQLLERYFDRSAPSVESAEATLKLLAATDVNFDLPGLGDTLGALRNLRVARAP